MQKRNEYHINPQSNHNLKITKYVDNIFLPTTAQPRSPSHHPFFANNLNNSTTSMHSFPHSHSKINHNVEKQCIFCEEMKALLKNNQIQEYMQKYQINQDDITLLEIMSPGISSEEFMSKLMFLHEKEEALICKEKENEIMHTRIKKKYSKINKTLSQVQPIACKDNQSFNYDLTTIREESLFDNTIRTQKNEMLLKSQQGEIQKIKKLKEACYIGLGKKIVSKTVKENNVELTKSNYHTRQFMLPIVHEHIEKLQRQNKRQKIQNKVYIIANAGSKGINFELESMPVKLEAYIKPNKYYEIFYCLNEIIQKTIFQKKERSKKGKQISKNYYILLTCLLMALSLYFINQEYIHSEIMEALAIVLSSFLLLFTLILSFHRFKQKISHESILDQLIIEISNYFQYVNSKHQNVLEWSIGKYLYWIEIKINHKNAEQ